MPTVSDQVLAESKYISRALGIQYDEARRDVQVLICWALRVSRSWLAAHERDHLEADVETRLHMLCNRRALGEPVAYITGTREFYGLEFAVSPDVLIPRSETELLVDLALKLVPENAPSRVLDLGTGSGAIAVALAHARPRAQVVATDLSAPALAIAHDNALRHGLISIRFVASDWYTAVTGLRFDLIVSNPPYVASGDAHLSRLQFEPALALTAGEDGLADLRKVIAGAPAHLNRGGHLLVEHGFDQAQACAELLRQEGFEALESHIDLAGIRRVACGRCAGGRTAGKRTV